MKIYTEFNLATFAKNNQTGDLVIIYKQVMIFKIHLFSLKARLKNQLKSLV